MTAASSASSWLRPAIMALLAAAGPAAAEMRPTLNLLGVTGLIDVPSATQQPDGYLSISSGHFGPISRTTLSFQIAPRLSGSFRYVAVRQWSALFCPPDCTGGNEFPTYYDRNFDLSYRLLDESQYLPAIMVGLQDFAGTGLDSAEYLVASKKLGDNIRVTAGLGWGRLASYNPIASFGTRPPIDFGQGGMFNLDQFFRGDVAPFGGIEWQINDKWGVKAEYSSDAYVEEAGFRGTFERRSPLNFGVEYQRSDTMRLGAYYMYGSEIGFALHYVLNPAQRPAGGMRVSAPEPVLPRPDRAADPDAWSPEWITQEGAGGILVENLSKHLKRSGIQVESLSYTGDTAQVRFRNPKNDAEAQAIGRVARAMSQVLPASVEVFELVPVVNGVAASMVTLHRTDIETLEFAPDNGDALRARTEISAAAAPLPNLTLNPEAYPQFKWSLGPYARLRLFNPGAPVVGDLGLRLAGSYEISPGIVFAGAVTQKLVGNLDSALADEPSALPPVRTSAQFYDAYGTSAIESLTAAWYSRLGKDLYGRVTAGYLERMFGGISTEVLWRPVNRHWALGAELNYAAQRNPDQGFNFDYYNYSVLTGHVSGYFDLGKGYHAQIDVGRYLAGDVGTTLSLSREFENGWKIGAFATLTNVSPEDFGEGSFDKGIKLEIPISWFTGAPTRASRPFILRPIQRDGGARLEVDGRLYDLLHSYDQSGIDAQWGRVWK